MPSLSQTMTRRRFLAGLAATLVILPARVHGQSRGPETSTDGFRILRAQRGTAHLRGPDKPATDIWGYDGVVPGPVLRLTRGKELRLRLVNDLPEETTLHWHGVRVPNAMDGVPRLTQAPVAPGASFDYRFAAPDAGTFWYHPHLYASEQLDRGLYGALIVEEPEPVGVDRDVVLILDDWRLNAGGSIDEASFRSIHDAAHAGRIGAHRLPPLRERTEDIPDLIRHFFAQAEREGLPPKQIDVAALDRLKRYRWPGNVRELENLARRLAALYPQDTITGAVMESELTQPALAAMGEEPRAEESLNAMVERHLTRYFAGFEDGIPPPGLYHRILREVEFPLVSAALAATRGNQIRAADLLGVNRNTLRKKIRDLDIQVVRTSG
jgi:DNA-binding protein Fis